MKKVIMSVRDVKAEYYLDPFVARTDDDGKRMFADVVNKSGSLLHEHPADFVLVRLGYFDVDSGVVSPCVTTMGTGIDYKVSSEDGDGLRS